MCAWARVQAQARARISARLQLRGHSRSWVHVVQHVVHVIVLEKTIGPAELLPESLVDAVLLNESINFYVRCNSGAKIGVECKTRHMKLLPTRLSMHH